MNQVTKILEGLSGGPETIYRGHANKDWELLPSIGRHFGQDWSQVRDRERSTLEEFKKRSIPYLQLTPKSDIEWLCLMQHHGCPTRLLDFTSNPLIALFFASDPTVKEDGELIVAHYGRRYENVANDELFNRTHAFAYYPPHITTRIIGQSGCFVYSPRPNKPLKGKRHEAITIPERFKILVRRELNMLGVSYSSLFPGVDGICQDLRDALISELSLEDLL